MSKRVPAGRDAWKFWLRLRRGNGSKHFGRMHDVDAAKDPARDSDLPPGQPGLKAFQLRRMKHMGVVKDYERAEGSFDGVGWRKTHARLQCLL